MRVVGFKRITPIKARIYNQQLKIFQYHQPVDPVLAMTMGSPVCKSHNFETPSVQFALTDFENSTFSA